MKQTSSFSFLRVMGKANRAPKSRPKTAKRKSRGGCCIVVLQQNSTTPIFNVAGNTILEYRWQTRRPLVELATMCNHTPSSLMAAFLRSSTSFLLTLILSASLAWIKASMLMAWFVMLWLMYVYTWAGDSRARMAFSLSFNSARASWNRKGELVPSCSPSALLTSGMLGVVGVGGALRLRDGMSTARLLFWFKTCGTASELLRQRLLTLVSAITLKGQRRLT